MEKEYKKYSITSSLLLFFFLTFLTLFMLIFLYDSKILIEVTLNNYIFYVVLALIVIFSFINYKKSRSEYDRLYYEGKNALLKKERQLFEHSSLRFIRALQSISNQNEEFSELHSKRIQKYSILIANELRLPSNVVSTIGMFAPLHNVGLVLSSNRDIDNREHVNAGYKIISDMNLGSVAENIVRYHHEHYNGEGYPEGLYGKNIPLEARIVCLAEFYDNLRMMGGNNYSHDKAIQNVLKQRGLKLDPKIVDTFMKIDNKFDRVYKTTN